MKNKTKVCIACASLFTFTILFLIPSASFHAVVSSDSVTPESIQQYSVATKDLVDGGFKEMSAQMAGKSQAYASVTGINWITDYMLENPTISAGEPTFTIPTYSIWQGKQLICYRLEDLIEHQILVECTFVHVDKPLEPSASIITYDGIDYAPNAVNIAIYREDGSVNRYYISNARSYSSKYTYSQTQISWSNSTNCDIVSKSGTGESYSNVSCSDFIVKFPSVNSIRNVLWLEDDIHENYITGFYNRDTGNNNLVDYITDLSILTGSVTMKIDKLNSQAWDSKQGNFRNYYASWVDSNNQNFNNYYSDERQFSYNSYFVGGTTINNSNYNDYYDGSLAPLFSPDIDWSLPDIDISGIIANLLPDIKASLTPQLDWVNNSLDSKINNYLQYMPDFNSEWGIGSQNDYLQIFNPLPPVTSGSGSGGNIEIPSYPAYNTSLDIEASVPELATATIAENVMQNVGSLFSQSWNFAELLGLSALIIPLFILGIIWKLTGGD